MTAWVKRGTKEEVGIITDYTDAESVYRHRSSALATQSDHRNIDCSLTEFNKKLVEQYLSIPWVETKCGYACSDQYVPNDPSERPAVSLKPFLPIFQCLVGQGRIPQCLHHWCVRSTSFISLSVAHVTSFISCLLRRTYRMRIHMHTEATFQDSNHGNIHTANE